MLLAMILSATGGYAQTTGTIFESGNCSYKVLKKDLQNPENNEVEVLIVRGTGKVIIPAKVQTPDGFDREWYKVVGSVAWVSKSEDAVTEIEFPEGFKSFSIGSFRNTKLQKIVIPASCETVSKGCFTACESLLNFGVKPGNLHYKAHTDGSLLSYDGKKLVYVPAGKSGEYTVPANVEEIMPSAFSNCRKLTTINIPASVARISDEADFPSFSSTGTHFKVDAGNAQFCDKEGLLCDQAGTKLIHVPFKWDKLVEPENKLRIPDGITEVEKNAAVNCFMKSLDLNQVKTIGVNAFASCSALESVVIGKDVEKIGEGAFTNCPKVEAFDVSSENARYQGKDGVLFTKPSADHLVLYPTGKTGEYTVPEGTVYIDAAAFTDVLNLEKINIAQSLKYIGKAAFKSAKKLKEINFTAVSNLEEVGENAFQYTKLERITIPASVKKLEAAAFADVETLKEVHFAAGSLLENLSPNLFQNAKNLTTVIFDGENKLQKINSSVFYNCISLTTFKIPKGVSSISGNAFKGTTGMETVEFEEPSILTSIGNGAFADSGIRHIRLPESVTLIDQLAFDHCTNLTKITIPKNVKEIKAGAFNFCEGLLEFVVDEANEKFSTVDGMLSDKNKKKLVVFPAGKADSKYTLVPYFEEVAEYAFYGSSKVSNITFPKTINTINIRALALCKNLRSLSFMGTDNVPSLDENILYESTNPKEVTIFVRKAWFEKTDNEEDIKKYNNKFKEVHPSFVPETGYDRGTEFFPTSVDNAGVIGFYTPRTSVIIHEKAKEKAFMDKFGKTHPEKDYTVSSILDFAYETETKARAVTVLADIGYIGLKAFKGNSIEGVYFVGDIPGELGSVRLKYGQDYPFRENQAIYVKESKVQAYKDKWEIDSHTLNITYKIPQQTNNNGGTVCYPFDVKYPSGQGSNDIKPYVPIDYTHAYDASNPFVRAYSIDNYYVPAFVGALIRSKNTLSVNSYCQMDEAQAHDESGLTAVGYSKTANNRMVGAVEDITIANESGYQYYAFSKSQGKFVKLNDGATFPYFKAYFRMASSAASPAKGFSILFDDDNTITGIDNVTEVGKDSDEAPYYNLDGMRVSKPTKGVYIHNGKKVIIK